LWWCCVGIKPQNYKNTHYTLFLLRGLLFALQVHNWGTTPPHIGWVPMCRAYLHVRGCYAPEVQIVFSFLQLLHEMELMWWCVPPHVRGRVYNEYFFICKFGSRFTKASNVYKGNRNENNNYCSKYSQDIKV
jgi:hypothetical protein